MQTREAREQRVAHGASGHANAPDVRHTPNLSVEKRLAAQRIAQELLERVSTLTDLGLGYLALERSTPTLSSGELQRLRLATQTGLAAVRRDLRAGRTLGRPASGRRRSAVRALQRLKARRQYPVRGRARPGNHAPRRLVDRRRPGGGRAWRPGAVQRCAGGAGAVTESQTRAYLFAERANRPSCRARPATGCVWKASPATI